MASITTREITTGTGVTVSPTPLSNAQIDQNFINLNEELVQKLPLSGGTLTGALTVGGNLTVNGTTFTINSTTVTVDDPIFSLGGDTAPVTDDNKDRGIEFRWHNGSVAKLGFFGFDDSTGKFTFVPDATNTSEVFSGTKGTIDANIEWADVLSKPNYVASVATTSPLSGGAAGSVGGALTLSLAAGYGDTQNPYASKTTSTFLAAPSVGNGAPSFRTIVASDIPTLNQSTTGNAATATTLQTARNINGVSFNGSADITIADSTKLPLSGGDMTGRIRMGSFSNSTVNSGEAWIGRAADRSTGTMTVQLGNDAARVFEVVDKDWTTVIFNAGMNNFTYKGNTIYHSGNIPTWNQNTTGNAATATTLQTARNINGVSFNGSADITIADSTKLPLTGGTLTGVLAESSTNDQALTLNKTSGTAWKYIGFSYQNTRRFYFGLNAAFEPELGVDNSATFRVIGNMTVGGSQVLHAGNYNSYALPLTGGTVTGVTTFTNPSDTQIVLNGAGTAWAGITFADVDNSDYLWYRGASSTFAIGGSGANVSGKKLHIHGGTSIGNGIPNTAVPTNGLLTEGSARFGSSFTASPAGVSFSHTLAGIGGSSRIVNFDGVGTLPSVWWTSVSRAYGAIDAQDPGLTFWANNGSSWQKQITMGYGTVNVDTALSVTGNATFGTLLKIGTDNTDWATGNYLRGSTNHLVIGVQAGGTLYANYGNSTGTFRVYGASLLVNDTNQILHAGNYNSYSPTLTGGGASGTWNINTNGYSIGTGYYHSGRDFTVGTYIQTNISVDSGEPWLLHITGNSYGSLIPFDIIAQGYNYGPGTFYAGGAVSNGTNIGSISVFRNSSGFLCFWFARQAYWQGFDVRCIVAYGTYNNNRVTNITDSAKPGSITLEAIFTPVQSLHTSNYSSYALPLSGGTVSGLTYFSANGQGVNGASTLRVNGDITTARGNGGAGVIYLGNSGSSYVYYDGANYFMPSGQLDVNGSRVLNAGNYNSYSPTLTGTGASGTWSINVAGNAATASSVAWTNVSGRPSTIAGLLGTDSVDANPSGRLGSGYYQQSSTTTANGWPVTSSWWHLHSVTHSNTANYYAMQLAADFYANNLYYRSTNGSGTTGWSRVILDTNYNSYSPTLTGGNASGTWGISITGNASGHSSHFPTLYAGGVQSNPQTYFSQSIGLRVAMTGVAGAWSDTLWINGYSGGDVLNMCALHTSRQATPRMWISSQACNGSSYGTLYEFLTTNNYNSYSPTLTGGNASGTWGINVTGSAGSVAWTNVSGRPTAVSSFSNDSGYITSGGRAYPRRSDGGDLNFYWSGQGGQPTWLWGGTDGVNMYVYNPSNFSVSYAATAGSAPANGGTSSAVTINYNNDSNSTYQMLWGSGNSVYGTGGIYCNPSTDYLYAGSFYTGNWFRSSGDTGWYSESYGGGIYMVDTTWVRTYNSKSIYTAGELAAAGNVTAYYSDERLKTNLGNIEGALSKLTKLNGFRYQNNELAKSFGYKTDKVQLGVSAQEVEVLFPEVVTLAPFDMETHKETGEITSKSGENYKTVAYDKLVPVLIEALKECAVHLDQQEARINKLEDLVRSLISKE